MNDSSITCNKIIEKGTIVTTNFNEKTMQSVNQKLYIFYLPFYYLLLSDKL